jgi:hypothetical protein
LNLTQLILTKGMKKLNPAPAGFFIDAA